MNNLVEELRKYFEGNSKEKILQDWSKSLDFDNIGSTVSEFLEVTEKYSVQTYDPDVLIKYTSNVINPKYTSGFLLNNKIYLNAKSSLFNHQISI